MYGVRRMFDRWRENLQDVVVGSVARSFVMLTTPRIIIVLVAL